MTYGTSHQLHYSAKLSLWLQHPEKEALLYLVLRLRGGHNNSNNDNLVAAATNGDGHNNNFHEAAAAAAARDGDGDGRIASSLRYQLVTLLS